MSLPIFYCHDCRAPIVYAWTRAGHRLPVDADPRPDGNCWLQPEAKRVIVHIVAKGSRAELYVPHFVTCPNVAARRRRPRAAITQLARRIAEKAAELQRQVDAALRPPSELDVALKVAAELAAEHPNDADLGGVVRELLLERPNATVSAVQPPTASTATFAVGRCVSCGVAAGEEHLATCTFTAFLSVAPTATECGDLPYHSFDSARTCCPYDVDSPVHDTSRRGSR